MSFTKPQIFNLALNKLLLQRQISNADTDNSNEAKVLRTVWDVAFESTLCDLDLDSLATQADLALIEEDPNDLWLYSYSYPSDCIKFRRLQSNVIKDDESTHIDKAVRVKSGVKCIFTNQEDAIIEYISSDVPLSALGASAALALACRLAVMAVPLIAGKGSKSLKESLENDYKIAKAEAQEDDANENFNPDDPATESSWVRERTS